MPKIRALIGDITYAIMVVQNDQSLRGLEAPVFPAVSPAAAARLLGFDLTAVARRIRRRELLAYVDTNGDFVLPEWQFSAQIRCVVPALFKALCTRNPEDVVRWVEQHQIATKGEILGLINAGDVDLVLRLAATSTWAETDPTRRALLDVVRRRVASVQSMNPQAFARLRSRNLGE